MTLVPDVGGAINTMDTMTLGKALVRAPLTGLTGQIDTQLHGVDPWKVVAGTAGATLAVAYLYNLTQQRVPLSVQVKKFIFKWVKKVPAVRRQIETEMEKMKTSFESEHQNSTEGIPFIHALPQEGMSHHKILDETKLHLNLGDLDWAGGAMSGTVYNSSKELGELMSNVYGLAAWTNPLHPDAFPGLRKMEAEIVSMACSIFNGGSDSCGCVTTGGTESIILACKAYRDLAREEKGIEVAEMIVPVTAHAAFDKAAVMLGMSIKHIPVDDVTKRVNVNLMKKMISRRTAMLVGSAPQFPHGSIDDIEDIAALGVRYGIPVHVDACLGGFLIAFMQEAGFPVKPFDFRVPGVTSISADTHKYGFAPKGSSTILYSSKKYRNFQYFSFPDWPGGIYATPTIGGSRAGGIVAACWAAMLFFGKDGYVKTTQEIITTTRKISDALQKIPGISIVGVPDVSVVAFDSKDFNIYGLSDGMKERGWALNALQFPSCVHLCVTRPHTLPGVADKFINDVREVTAEIMKDPSASNAGSAAMYGMAASIPDRSIVENLTGVYLDALYCMGPKPSKEKNPDVENGKAIL